MLRFVLPESFAFFVFSFAALALIICFFFTATASAQQDAAAMLNQARGQIAASQYAAAEQTLLEIISNDPGSPLRPDALQELSRAYELMNRPVEAAGALQQLYEEAPDGPMAAQALYNRARLLGNAGRREEAVLVFTLLLEKFPAHPNAVNARFQSSAILRSLSRPDEAIQLLKPLLRSDIKNDVLQASRSLADIYFQLERWYEAEAEIDKVLAAESNNDYYSELLARIFEAQGEYEKALDVYENLYVRNPNNGYYENALFKAYEQAGVLDQRIAALKKRADKTPPDMEAVRKLARLYLWQGNSLDALVQFETLVKAEPGMPEYAVTLARLYYENQWKDKARQTLERVLEKNPNHVDAWRQLGDIHHAEGRADQARAAWEKSVQFNPADLPSYLRLGSLLMGKQLFNEASGLYEQGRAALGNDMLFTQELISLYNLQMRPRDAVNEFLRMLTAGQAPPSLAANMLASITGEELRNSAFEIMQPWLSRAPDSRELLGFFAQAAAALDRMDRAHAALDAYAAAHPDEPDIFYDTARALLDVGQYAGAASLFATAADRPLPRTQQSAALMGAANAWLWANSPDTATAYLERVARDFSDTPDAPEAAFRLAGIYAEKGACAQASDLFSKLLESNPDGPYAAEALLGRSRCLISMGRYNEAETDLTTLWNMPNASRWFDEILYMQGESRFLRGIFDEAEKYYRRIAESFPESRFVNNALTRLLFITAADGVDTIAVQAFMEAEREMRFGDTESAATLFEGLSLTMAGTSLAPHALFELAGARRAQGRATDAETLCLQIADAGPDSELFAPALLQAAEIQSQLGRPRDALRTYQRLLDLDPGNFWAHVAREKVQELIPLIDQGSS
jgi:tetratricopeptide (TPR) repeat protein